MFNQRRFRPLGLADIFDEAFDLYKSNFLLFLAAAAVVYVPLQAFIIIYVSPQTDKLTRLSPDQVMTYFGSTASTLVIDIPIELAAYGILSCGLIYIISQRYLERPVTLVSGFLHSLRRIVPLTFNVLITTILIFVGLVCCVLPGLYLACRYVATQPVQLLEPARSPFAAMKRSYNLTANFTGRIFGCLILLGLITLSIMTAIEGSIDMALNFIPFGAVPGLEYLAQNKDIASEIADAVAALLVSPFSYTLITVLYYDMRIREEGFDMAILAHQLGFTNDASLAGQLPQANPPAGPPAARQGFWRSRGTST